MVLAVQVPKFEVDGMSISGASAKQITIKYFNCEKQLAPMQKDGVI